MYSKYIEFIWVHSTELLSVFLAVLIVLCVYIYTVMAKHIGTLGKYDQRRLWKLICIVNPFDIL